MNDSLIKMLILYCLHRIDRQRTIFSIFHLLKGKKSAQTIQDAHFFQLTNLFHTFTDLTRTEFEELVLEMEKQGYLEGFPHQSFRLTSDGYKHMELFFEKQPIPMSLNGWKFHQVTELFWERLSLAVQVVSHLKSWDSKFIPIQRKKELHSWLKGFIQRTGLNREELGVKLYEELVDCLEEYKENDPSLLVLRLTGYQIIGLTTRQAAEKMNVDNDTYQLRFIALIHYMLENIQENPTDYPILRLFVTEDNEIFPLTHSAKKTYDLLKKGFFIEEIARIRRLKSNTIEDHIVEISLNSSSFDISSFVSTEKQKLILDAIMASNSKQLKQIRQFIPDANYFEIRLVLTRVGEKI
ncbi:helix-turn-helix domain-containing protein [Bacillus sp. FJAT-49705]|uniref:Helix-turn-helix domain-containing protein n=1 Tax=Cytobacillus citreus TaxID=2833586 RepID=A0ABS5NVC8_9BACI|nr:helix-turn-helix domain-containing protein [Cytobacillus citreus]MBS4191073.1 helix-turn-helix domain-containing protein [Cytobacillus citreus]